MVVSDFQLQPKLEKLDLELVRKDQRRGEISLADQIQAAKNQQGNHFPSKIDIFALKSMDSELTLFNS
ncbi:hypothetical protein Bca4012_063063 [Brassica carinata]